MLHRAIARHVHDRRAIDERAQLIERGEGRAGVCRLVSHGAVELGRMPDRLVNGQPQIGGIDHEVVCARVDRRGAQLLGEVSRACGPIRRPSPIRRRPSRTPIHARRAEPACAWSRSRRRRGRAPPSAGDNRTRRCVARVPLKSAKYVSSPTLSTSAVTWETTSSASNRRLRSSSSATLSARGTVAGSMSNALVHVTSPCEGSGASSTRPPPA